MTPKQMSVLGAGFVIILVLLIAMMKLLIDAGNSSPSGTTPLTQEQVTASVLSGIEPLNTRLGQIENAVVRNHDAISALHGFEITEADVSSRIPELEGVLEEDKAYLSSPDRVIGTDDDHDKIDDIIEHVRTAAAFLHQIEQQRDHTAHRIPAERFRYEHRYVSGSTTVTIGALITNIRIYLSQIRRILDAESDDGDTDGGASTSPPDGTSRRSHFDRTTQELLGTVLGDSSADSMRMRGAAGDHARRTADGDGTG